MRLLVFLVAILSLHICAAQDFAIQQLDQSPRHNEWVKVVANGRNIHAFLTYPERSEPSIAVIVIHENRGLTDWVRSFADQLSGAGYLAIAPDLLSEYSKANKRTSDFTSSDEARNAIYELDQNQIRDDLHGVYDYITNHASSNGKVAVVGFCWGGSQTFRYATNNWDIGAALVFYGRAPKEQSELEEISAPVYGFYGQNDQRVNATIPETKTMMEEAGKTFEYRIYQGAGHAFMRHGDNPKGSEANKNANKNAWFQIKKILRGL